MAQPELKKANRKLTWQLWLFAAGSLAFGFALVPLYNVLCEVTGYGDRSKLVEAASVVEAPDDNRTVTIELSARIAEETNVAKLCSTVNDRNRSTLEFVW